MELNFSFDLVEEAETHLASVTGKRSEVPSKKPKKKSQETDKKQETETQDDLDTSNRGTDAGTEKDTEKKKLEKLQETLHSQAVALIKKGAFTQEVENSKRFAGHCSDGFYWCMTDTNILCVAPSRQSKSGLQI